jgi:phosphatidate phosphatase APP1
MPASSEPAPEGRPRRHPASQVERQIRSVVGPRLLSHGWTPRVVPFTGYGRRDQVRLLARVLLTPPRTTEPEATRGWRRFLSAPASYVEVCVEIGEVVHRVRSDRDGYVDVLLRGRFEPGWTTARWSVGERAPAESAVRVVAPGRRLGVVSDLDDTVIVTMLPRPLVAFRNAFLLHEDDRRPVRGMARFYRQLARAHPDLPFVYVSTGAWNVAPPLTRFLRRHAFPPGPMLLTDWGPTEQAVFRSGREHKRRQLRRLFDELPDVQWLLVGDDGQNDPFIYAEAAQEHPDQVAGIVIRQLSPGEQLATRGLTHHQAAPHDLDVVTGEDGDALATGLRARGLLPG